MRCGQDRARWDLKYRLMILVMAVAFSAAVALAEAGKPPKKDSAKKPAAAPAAKADQGAKAEAAEEEKPEREKEGAEGEPGQGPVASLFTDFLHFIKIGQFQIANNFAEALLKHPDAKPVRLLELSEQHPDSIEVLDIVLANSDVGASARRVLERINEGRQIRRRDPNLIKADIAALAGEPLQVLNATQRLQWSGEYAVQWMIAALLDPAQSKLHPFIIKALPKLGLPAVTPLAMALRANGDVVKLIVVEALAQIGYPHALPYLKAVVEDPKVDTKIREAAAAAVRRIGSQGGASDKTAAALFLDLANQYYANTGSIRPDPREDESNVWYWRVDSLQADRVPRDIFPDVMAMRCCEEALLRQPDSADALALWIAADFRREEHLGVADVSSDQPDKACEKDVTRPKGYPRAIYFARSAGPRFNHMVLGRALKDADDGVALGAITALAETAGESSLIGRQDVKQPLVEALTFPDSIVRIRAALALGRALPQTRFEGSAEVIPVLAEALGLTGQRNVVVVDADPANLNHVMGILRDAGLKVVGEAGFGPAMKAAHEQLPTLEGCFLATDISEPDVRVALAELRKRPGGRNLPVVLLTKERQMAMAEEITREDQGVGRVLASQDKARLLGEWQAVNRRLGRVELNAETATSMAMASAATLRLIAAGHSPVYDVGRAESALIAALKHDVQELRVLAAQALAMIPSAKAQQSVAIQALDEANKDDLRIELFSALAESGRQHGNKLDDGQLSKLVEIAMKEKKLPIRTAASQALGALNVPGNRASEIIRAQYRG
jgi:CheY-like chemotaxis protein